MIIGKRNLRLIFIFSVVAVPIVQGGCSFLSSEPAPLTYSSVATVPIPVDVHEPFGIAVKDGVIYLSDGGSGTIRGIGADGNVTTMATGLNTPSAIAFLPSGELVVADTGSHTIRIITNDGTVSIVAGVENIPGSSDGPASSATFNAPVGIAVDSDGSVFVADTYNDRIRVIRDGVVTTTAGERRGFADGVGTSANFDTPLGLAIWEDKLLVADSGNARIRVMEKTGLVATLAGGNGRDLSDGSLSSAQFVNPTAVAADGSGRIFVADGNAIRVIGGRAFPFVETVAGDRRGYANGSARLSRFSRPSSIALGSTRELYVADSDNRTVRVISGDDNTPGNATTADVNFINDQLPLATRWPFDPPSNPREIAGTLGEIRGDLKPDGKPVWFHNGLDIAGAYGETVRCIRDETVLDPRSTDNFGTSRELLRLPLIGYIHLRLGRGKDERSFDDPRFQFERDADGKLAGVRVPRGARFAAGEAIGTLNAMNHVHLITGRSGHEINALAALQLPGVRDSIAPVIENVLLYETFWDRLEVRSGDQGIRLPDKVRVVIQAYDRMDGNSDRRRLGIFRVGFQLLPHSGPPGDIEWRISFSRSPSHDAVRLAYAEGSRSGYTPDTIFNYIATNRVDGEDAREDFLDTTTLPPGRYTLRVFAADYFGNITARDIEVVK